LSSFNATPSFVLIRDRIISSWKSKVTCKASFGVDIYDRKRIVPELLNLAGFSGEFDVGTPESFDGLCLDLSKFLRILYSVHKQGKQPLLNSHFLPQNHGCFRQIPLHKWSVIVTVATPGARCSLARVVSGLERHNIESDGGCDFPRSHSTANLSSHGVKLSPMDEAILNAITL
jgi:hypothetical protein